MRMWRGEAEGGEGRRGAQRQRVSRGAAEGSWAEDQKRQDVRVGRFTEQEKQTLKDAVRECARPPPPLLGLPTHLPCTHSWRWCDHSRRVIVLIALDTLSRALALCRQCSLRQPCCDI